MEKTWQQRLADYIEASTKRFADKLRREEFKTQYQVNIALSALRQSITVASAHLSEGHAIPAEEHSVHEFGYRGTASREALEEAGLTVTYPSSEHSVMVMPDKDDKAFRLKTSQVFKITDGTDLPDAAHPFIILFDSYKAHQWRKYPNIPTDCGPNNVVTSVVAKSSGMKCSGGCGEFNEYAEPNQPNNTYICFRCRG